MKLMTYNILNGGEAGLDHIIEVIKKESPDYLTINEANTFVSNDNKILKDFAVTCGFDHYGLALSGEYDYHVAAFSKKKWQNVKQIRPLMRACMLVEFKTNIGPLSIASFHLSPYSEDSRLSEIDLITLSQKGFENKVLMGDMNSLSPFDNYDPKTIETFNDMQLKKFTKDGRFRFDAIKRIMFYGYLDSALEMKCNGDYTAPTSINEYSAHSNMRLDYVFISEPLRPHLIKYYVVKNPITEKTSDHYPVVAKFKGIQIVN